MDESFDNDIYRKYVGRGFRFSTSRAQDDAIVDERLRWLGDSRCWRIPLDTSDLIIMCPTYLPLLNTSWRLVQSSRPLVQSVGHPAVPIAISYKMTFHSFQSPAFQSTYVVGDHTMRNALVTIIGLFTATPPEYRQPCVSSVPSSSPCVDVLFSSSLDSYAESFCLEWLSNSCNAENTTNIGLGHWHDDVPCLEDTNFLIDLIARDHSYQRS